MMSDNEHLASAESILRNAQTFEASYKKMSKIAGGLGVLTLLFGMSTVYLAINRPEPRYFATTTDGQLLPLVPLDRPHQTAAEVSNFAVKAVTTSLTYDFANYRADFNNALQTLQNQKAGTISSMRSRRVRCLIWFKSAG